MNYKAIYEICMKKARIHMQRTTGELFELRESPDGEYRDKGEPLASFWNWMTSFVTGMAPLMFETHGDSAALDWTNGFKGQYAAKVSGDNVRAMHDLGFLYLPYSVQLYRLTGDKEHRDTALRAADALLKRFDVKGGYIDAWSEVNAGEKEIGWAIIDSMMNVPLLLWAWKETGYLIYRDVAVRHTETILENFVRDDYSVCHAFWFDPQTGKRIEEHNDCGYSNGSHWARGTAWIVYGLASVYSYTNDEHYIDIAVKISKKFIECLTEADFIPVWDFKLPQDEPARECRDESKAPGWDEKDPENKKYNRDTSAAAIMSCAFMLIDSLRGNREFSDITEKMMSSLGDIYFDRNENIPGMLRRADGCNSFAVFGDYFFMQALAMKEYGINGAW